MLSEDPFSFSSVKPIIGKNFIQTLFLFSSSGNLKELAHYSTNMKVSLNLETIITQSTWACIYLDLWRSKGKKIKPPSTRRREWRLGPNRWLEKKKKIQGKCSLQWGSFCNDVHFSILAPGLLIMCCLFKNGPCNLMFFCFCFFFSYL